MRKYLMLGIVITALLVSVLVGLRKCNTADDKEATLEFDVFNNREEELVFSFSMTDFINSYNKYYRKEKRKSFLPSAEQWLMTEYDSAIHSDYETKCYDFSPDVTVWSYPTMTVYVPSNADFVQEITLNFDDHSYTEQMYSLYEEMCFYTLKVFFPDFTEERIEELYQTLNQLAHENIQEAWYANDPTPCALYYKDGIGLYPYFAIGQRVRLCIIPVNQKLIHEFSEKGVEIHNIE